MSVEESKPADGYRVVKIQIEVLTKDKPERVQQAAIYGLSSSLANSNIKVRSVEEWREGENLLQPGEVYVFKETYDGETTILGAYATKEAMCADMMTILRACHHVSCNELKTLMDEFEEGGTDLADHDLEHWSACKYGWERCTLNELTVKVD